MVCLGHVSPAGSAKNINRFGDQHFTVQFKGFQLTSVGLPFHLNPPCLSIGDFLKNPSQLT